MDSKVVNAQIKQRIWPELKSIGFNKFSSRTAWRHHSDRIDVVNFQSFNSYNADVIGCTTFSFTVNLGCYLLAIPPQFEPSRLKIQKGILLPQEYECHMRGQLSPTIQQPKLLATDIWFIDESGENLAWSITDVIQLLQREATSWFKQFESQSNVLRILLDEPETMSRLWGFGRNPSPIRHYFTGYMALRVNQLEGAKLHLEKALASGCFSSVRDRLACDAAAAAQQIAPAEAASRRG
jgi:Domain of unknown function (DUF4304)